jgi:serine-type anaerobic sulfatase-maturating enzyme
MFDAWFDDPDPTISIEPIQQHIARILNVPGVVHACHFTRGCHHSFLGSAPDGDFYPCGMFQGEPAFRYGNIHSMSPEDIATTALFGRIENREARVLEGCFKCAFFDLCYGGCMFHSLKNSGLFEEKDYYCAGYKRYFEHVLRRIQAHMHLMMRRL